MMAPHGSAFFSRMSVTRALPCLVRALQGLHLQRNALTGTLPEQWGALGELRVAYAHDNALSGPLPGAWSGLASIEVLHLSANQLAGSLPPAWGSLGHLQVSWAA